ncbi:MAG: response regulator [Anaerolineaceae bacterium]|nr:response regulator [Anaerolineaceae bacterium]
MNDIVFENKQRHDFLALYNRTFHYIVAAITLVAQSSIVVADLLFHPLPTGLIALLLVLSCTSAISFILHQTYPVTVSYGYSLLIWLWCAWIVTHGFSVGPYLLALVVLVALGITGQRFAAFIAIISTLFLLLAPLNDVPLYLRLLYGVLIAFTFLFGLLIFRSLLETLDLAWNYQNYAVQQMQDARSHRAEQMQLNKALKEAQENLAHAYIQLDHARNAAEEARRLKAQFAANVSHEFRTPINLIVGFSEIIVNSANVYATPLPAVYKSDIQTIYESAKHLQSLINDVLDISQIEAGYLSVVKELVNPYPVIMEAANLMRDMIENNGLIFAVDIPDSIPLMWLDRVRIRQVLLNLLSNATRFTTTGQVGLKAFVDSQKLEISVIDTGQGIHAKDIEHVFDEFYQADSSERGGSGLGLTLSKEFIEQHNGKITVQSTGVPGEGTTFTVTLPLEKTYSAPLKPHTATFQAEPRDKDKYFVVFDEDPAVVQLFKRYSKRHRVLTAQTREQAIHLVKTVNPTALVVSAENMSNELFERDFGQTAVICCPMPSGRRAMQLLGVADYLVKPVSQEMLFQSLNRLDKVPQTALVIDDDPDIVRLFSRILKGFPSIDAVWEAYSGSEGIALMSYQLPDVIILDLLMPDIDGFSVIQLLKADPILRQIPIILASAHGAEDALTRSAKGNIAISKRDGFQPVELVKCVETLVDALRPINIVEVTE